MLWPRKKTVTLSRAKDLVVTLHHDSPKTLPEGTTPGITLYNVTGVHSLVNDPTHRSLLTNQTPRVHLMFTLDSSGIVSLTKAEATLEETIQVPVKKKKNITQAEDQKTNATGDGPTEATAPESETQTQNHKAETSENENENEIAADTSTTSTSDQTNSEKQTENQEQNSNPTDSQTSSSSTERTIETILKEAETVKEEVEYVSKVVTRQFPLQVSSGGFPGTVSPLSRTDLFKSRQLLSKLRKQDQKNAS